MRAREACGRSLCTCGAGGHAVAVVADEVAEIIRRELLGNEELASDQGRAAEDEDADAEAEAPRGGAAIDGAPLALVQGAGGLLLDAPHGPRRFGLLQLRRVVRHGVKQSLALQEASIGDERAGKKLTSTMCGGAWGMASARECVCL